MTTTAKKAKPSVKTKKTTAKKDAVAAEPRALGPSHEEIAQLANKFWAGRGWQDGNADQDWLHAEQALQVSAS